QGRPTLQAWPIIFCISAAILPESSGLAKNRLSIGISLPGNFNCPDTIMILIVGQCLETLCASWSPSMLPGICMSVNSNAISDLDLRMAKALSAPQLRSRYSQHLPPYRPPTCGVASRLQRQEQFATLKSDAE